MILHNLKIFYLQFGIFKFQFKVSPKYVKIIKSMVSKNIINSTQKLNTKIYCFTIYIVPNNDIIKISDYNLANKYTDTFILFQNVEYKEFRNLSHRLFFSKNKKAPNFIIIEQNLFIGVPSINSFFEYYLNRIIITFTQVVLMQHKFYTVHASAIRYNNSTFIFPGISGSGKSTLLNYLINLSNCSYIANDRLLLSDNYIVHALPLPIRTKKNNKSYDINLKTLIKHRAVNISIFSSVQHFIFPVYVNSINQFSLKKINKEKFQRLLMNNVLLDHDNPFIKSYYNDSKENIKLCVELLASKYTAYTLLFGINDLSDKKMASSLLSF